MSRVLNDVLIGAGVGIAAGSISGDGWFGLGCGLLAGGIADVAQREWQQEPYYQGNVYNNGDWCYGGWCSTPNIDFSYGMLDNAYEQGYSEGFWAGSQSIYDSGGYWGSGYDYYGW